jgi:hypothetical protein
MLRSGYSIQTHSICTPNACFKNQPTSQSHLITWVTLYNRLRPPTLSSFFILRLHHLHLVLSTLRFPMTTPHTKCIYALRLLLHWTEITHGLLKRGNFFAQKANIFLMNLTSFPPYRANGHRANKFPGFTSFTWHLLCSNPVHLFPLHCPKIYRHVSPLFRPRRPST